NMNYILVLLNFGRSPVASLKNAPHLYERDTLNILQLYPRYTQGVSLGCTWCIAGVYLRYRCKGFSRTA
ncbi:MAG TPA: hypothetical protein VGC08_15475, partial [Pedobacter sp.]